MNAIQKIGARLLGLKALGDPIPGAGVMVPRYMDNRPVERPWARTDLLRVATSACEVAANCMVFRASAVSRAPFGRLVGGVIDPTHELSQLFARSAESFFSQADFWQQVVYTLDASPGGVYILAPLDARGMPAQLWVRSDQHIRPVASSTAFISGYEMYVDNGWRPIDPDLYAVWQHRYVSPDVDNLYGSWPPLQRAAGAVRSYGLLGAMVEDLLRNKALVDGFITNKDPALTDSSVIAQIDATVQETYNGVSRGGVHFLPGTMQYVKVGAGLDDIDPGTIEDRFESKIAAAFQLNPVSARLHSAMDVTSSLGGDKVEQFIRQDWWGTIVPIMKALAADVGIAIAALYGLDPSEVGFDLSGIDELDESIDARVARAQKMTGFARINEQRKIAGLEEIPEGDVVPALEQLAWLTATRQSLTPPKHALPGMQHKTLTGEMLRKAVDLTAEANEPMFATAARGVFASERKRVLAAIDAAGKARQPHSLDAKARADRARKEIADDVDSLIDEAEWAAAMRGPMAAALTDGASLQELGIAFDVANPHTVAAIAKRVTKLSGHVTETTRASIRNAIADNREAGGTMRELADEIKRKFDMADDSRAMLIARTEAIGAANAGGFEMGSQAAESGLNVVKAWLAFLDDKTRATHILDESDVPYDEPFSNGLMFPGDPAAGPEETCNCRCSSSYYVLGDTSVTAVVEAEG